MSLVPTYIYSQTIVMFMKKMEDGIRRVEFGTRLLLFCELIRCRRIRILWIVYACAGLTASSDSIEM